MTLLKGQREILLTVARFFLLLPMLLLYALRPFTPSGAQATLLQEYVQWATVNLHWLMLTGVLAGLGRLAILILLMGPGRPTVGEAIGAAARLLILFLAMVVLMRLMLFGASLLFVVPALYVFGRLFLAEAAFVAERAHNPVAGITRSFEVTRGNGWRIFFVALIIYLGVLILRAAIGFVVGVLAALSGLGGLERFVNAFVDATADAGLGLILTLISVGLWRRRADQGNVRSGAFG
ncbi:MAG TPA: hypothetical protein VGT77_07225 [Sphingomonas sp.]|nr:hypothetical protein [Sphingomonas sp.]